MKKALLTLALVAMTPNLIQAAAAAENVKARVTAEVETENKKISAYINGLIVVFDKETHKFSRHETNGKRITIPNYFTWWPCSIQFK